MGTFVLRKDPTGTFYFSLVASNGDIILTSEAYDSKGSATDGIRAVRSLAADAQVKDETRRKATPGHRKVDERLYVRLAALTGGSSPPVSAQQSALDPGLLLTQPFTLPPGKVVGQKTFTMPPMYWVDLATQAPVADFVDCHVALTALQQPTETSPGMTLFSVDWRLTSHKAMTTSVPTYEADVVTGKLEIAWVIRLVMRNSAGAPIWIGEEYVEFPCDWVNKLQVSFHYPPIHAPGWIFDVVDMVQWDTRVEAYWKCA